MRFHLRLKNTGRWVGGADCRAGNKKATLEGLRWMAREWGEPVVATRVDRRGDKAGETFIIEAEEGKG